MNKLIGITGKKRSGKDTAASILVTQCGYERFSFASILKAMTYTCLDRLDIAPETASKMVDGDMKEMKIHQLCNQTARHAMQTLGTEWGRKCVGDDFWVSACMRNASAADKAVISDVRYENESQAIREAGGKVIRITRDGCDGDGHSSEVMDFEVDFTIENNDSIETLTKYIIEYERGN
jgi:hypothetical protein